MRLLLPVRISRALLRTTIRDLRLIILRRTILQCTTPTILIGFPRVLFTILRGIIRVGAIGQAGTCIRIRDRVSMLRASGSLGKNIRRCVDYEMKWFLFEGK